WVQARDDLKEELHEMHDTQLPAIKERKTLLPNLRDHQHRLYVEIRDYIEEDIDHDDADNDSFLFNNGILSESRRLTKGHSEKYHYDHYYGKGKGGRSSSSSSKASKSSSSHKYYGSKSSKSSSDTYYGDDDDGGKGKGGRSSSKGSKSTKSSSDKYYGDDDDGSKGSKGSKSKSYSSSSEKHRGDDDDDGKVEKGSKSSKSDDYYKSYDYYFMSYAPGDDDDGGKGSKGSKGSKSIKYHYGDDDDDGGKGGKGSKGSKSRSYSSSYSSHSSSSSEKYSKPNPKPTGKPAPPKPTYAPVGKPSSKPVEYQPTPYPTKYDVPTKFPTKAPYLIPPPPVPQPSYDPVPQPVTPPTYDTVPPTPPPVNPPTYGPASPAMPPTFAPTEKAPTDGESTSGAPSSAPTVNLPPAVRPTTPTEMPVPTSPSEEPSHGFEFGKETMQPSENVSDEPSMAPPPTEAVPSTVQVRIQEFALGKGMEWEDPNSYQSVALRRVEEQEGADDMTTEKLLQYYSLYCIFTATNSRINKFIAVSDAFDEEGIPGWKETFGWLETNVDPCDGWWGISCVDDTVTEIVLFNNGLTGNFPPEVIMFASDGMFATGAGQLVVLDLFDNVWLSNTDDNRWMEFLGSQLGFLYFQNTMFSGELPGKFPNGLVELDMANTMITGGLKGSAFSELNALKFLLMDGVQFNSSMPIEIASLPNLEFLFAVDSMITGDLSYMTSMGMVVEHWIDRNPGITGTIPNLSGQNTLQSFSASGCNLNGRIPSSLGNLTEMRQMWLYNNNLEGEIPASLGRMKFARILEVQGNNMLGGMPQTVCNNFNVGMLEVLGADCSRVDCTCCNCCSVEECQELRASMEA
ncbi:MAG: hypothetical protein SGILL_001803, partial [Bacillariaceae sp.]